MVYRLFYEKMEHARWKRYGYSSSGSWCTSFCHSAYFDVSFRWQIKRYSSKYFRAIKNILEPDAVLQNASRDVAATTNKKDSRLRIRHFVYSPHLADISRFAELLKKLIDPRCSSQKRKAVFKCFTYSDLTKHGELKSPGKNASHWVQDLDIALA